MSHRIWSLSRLGTVLVFGISCLVSVVGQGPKDEEDVWNLETRVKPSSLPTPPHLTPASAERLPSPLPPPFLPPSLLLSFLPPSLPSAPPLSCSWRNPSSSSLPLSSRSLPPSSLILLPPLSPLPPLPLSSQEKGWWCKVSGKRRKRRGGLERAGAGSAPAWREREREV
ncbi:unnamed protein product, partial [Pleuronectes platessa]